ncbi:MAG TPA: alpha/beta family hydrolase [Candidatus Methylacidiphilales bacterium]
MITQSEANVLAHHHEAVRIPCERGVLEGDLEIPAKAHSLVLFAHGSGSSQYSHRNQLVARILREAGMGTLLFNLLTAQEQREDEITSQIRYDIEPLADRLVEVTDWARRHRPHHAIGYFGSSTGAAVALLAAAEMGTPIAAVVSRGGRPDLAGDNLPRVLAPTLLIVGERDTEILRLNERAFAELHSPKSFSIVPGATHLFAEPGTLEKVATLTADWFRRYLTADETDRPS